MKKIILSLVLFCFAYLILNAQSPTFQWAKSMGGYYGYAIGKSIALDNSNNVYTIGYFEGRVEFDPGAGTFYLTSAGQEDIFISKSDASGNFIWAKQLGGTFYDYGHSIKADGAGNVYSTGRFTGTGDFDPGSGTFNMTSAGGEDIFICKLNASGNFVWAKQVGAIPYDAGYSITLDGSGSLYTTGTFMGLVDFNPGAGTFNMTSAGLHDVFVLKSDTSGNFIWAKQLGGTSYDFPTSIVTDGSGNLYCTGYFQGTSDFDPGAGTFNLTSFGNYDIFVSKFNATGSLIWAKQLGGTMEDHGNSIVVDASGNVYSTGYFRGTADFDPGAATFNLTSASSSQDIFKGDPDMFVHKMSQCTPPSAAITPAGPTTFCSGGSVVLNVPPGANKTYQWKKGANLISGATLSSYTATTGGNYRVIVTNTVTGCSKTTNSATTVTVNALPAATITPQGPTTFCAGGSVVLAANTGAGLTYKWKKGSNFISGATLSNYTATIGGNYRVQVTNSNGCSKTSALVAVSVPCKEGETISQENIFDFTVYPNPNSGEFTIKFLTKPTSPIQIELIDAMGKVVKRFETNDETVVIKESNLAKGIYCLTARNKDEVVIKKINIVK